MMEYRNPTFTEAGAIDCEIEHPKYGWIPFTASPDDPEELGRVLFAGIVDAGDAAAYVAPTAPTAAELLAAEREAMQCSPLQMRRALRMTQRKSAVDAYIAEQDEATQETWEFALVIRRTDPLMVAAIALLGTPEEGDDLFRLAATI